MSDQMVAVWVARAEGVDAGGPFGLLETPVRIGEREMLAWLDAADSMLDDGEFVHEEYFASLIRKKIVSVARDSGKAEEFCFSKGNWREGIDQYQFSLCREEWEEGWIDE